jgi:serine protease AprX
MTILTRQFASALAVLCLLGTAAPVDADPGRAKLDRALRGVRADSVQPVILQAGPGRLAQLRALCARLGVEVRAEHPGLEALTVSVRGEDLARLAASPEVLAASSDAEVTAFGMPGLAARSTSAHAREVTLRESLGLSTSRFSGQGINVAIVDSGIDASSDVGPNVAGFWDFTAGDLPTRPRDEYGHGTHVAGLIASTGRDSDGRLAGLAPGSRLYGFKVLDANGRGRVSDVVRALEFIVAHRQSADPDALRIDIINLSLGHPIFEPAATDPLVRAVEQAVRAGFVVITSAGNAGQRSDGLPGYAGITSPGNAPSAITVGAVDHQRTTGVRDDRVAPFSSRGPTWFDAYGKPDLVAPGVNLVSNAPADAALFAMYADLRVSRAFGSLTGTSMAAAVVTGVASQVLEASRAVSAGRPGLTPNALKAILQYTAVPLADGQIPAYDPLTQGTGMLNPDGALVLARAIDTGMPEGASWQRGRPQPQSVIGGVLEPWSQALIWADQIVWGSDALASNGAPWSTDIVWGTRHQFENIVWGTSRQQYDNIVWGTARQYDNIVWGTVRVEHIVWGAAADTWMDALASADRVIGQKLDATNIVWGTLEAANIVWGTLEGENIVWGTLDASNIVWGTLEGENIVWGTLEGEHIVWGMSRPRFDNIVWGTARAQFENIVWGTARPRFDNIVWGTADGALAGTGADAN